MGQSELMGVVAEVGGCRCLVVLSQGQHPGQQQQHQPFPRQVAGAA
jgi:hypothetical protein